MKQNRFTSTSVYNTIIFLFQLKGQLKQKHIASTVNKLFFEYMAQDPELWPTGTDSGVWNTIFYVTCYFVFARQLNSSEQPVSYRIKCSILKLK